MKLVRPPVLSHSPLLTFQEIESNWRKGEEKAGKKRTTSNAGLLMQGVQKGLSPPLQAKAYDPAEETHVCIYNLGTICGLWTLEHSVMPSAEPCLAWGSGRQAALSRQSWLLPSLLMAT